MARNPSKASMSFRISVRQSIFDDRFHKLMMLFQKHKGVPDEVVTKAHAMGCEAAAPPNWVGCIQSELESFCAAQKIIGFGIRL